MVSAVAAPAAFRFVIDFLNTVDLRTYGPAQGLLDRDQLKDAESTRRWLIRKGWPPEGASIPEEDAKGLRALRRDLREGFTGRGFSRRCEFELVFGPGVEPSLRWERDGVEGAVAKVLTDLVAAAMTPAWARLRVCAAPDCGWAFFDSSRNGRARWCSMKTCGNRMKTRAYRQRRAAALPAVTRPLRPESRTTRRRRSIFRLEGDFWSISHGGRTFQLRDTKGLRYIARLLAEPNREVHVLDLVSSGDVASRGAPLLDHAARNAYRARLDDLQDEITDAERWKDHERAARAREELEFLATELRRSVGLGGRDRTFTSDSERARVSVTRVIKAALTRISDESPELKHHFGSTLRTGTYCSYAPDRRLPVNWEL